MDDCNEDLSPLEQELEALSAIFIDELSFDRTEDGKVREINLLIRPATGNDTTKQFVCMNLIFHPTSKYPDEVPPISIRNPRGLSQEEVSGLVDDMTEKAAESVGEVMLYTLIEMAKDCLTEGNIPHSPCIVCLEHFDENSQFHRTGCYHYFHNLCLHKYLIHERTQQMFDEAENATSKVRHMKDQIKEIVCPMCRCPLDEGTLAVHCPDVSSDSDDKDHDIFVPTDELRQQQRKMASRYELQRSVGGIIDLEWERNKYLLSRITEDPLLAAMPLAMLNNEEDDEYEGFPTKDSSSLGGSNLNADHPNHRHHDPINFRDQRYEKKGFQRHGADKGVFKFSREGHQNFHGHSGKGHDRRSHASSTTNQRERYGEGSLRSYDKSINYDVRRQDEGIIGAGIDVDDRLQGNAKPSRGWRDRQRGRGKWREGGGYPSNNKGCTDFHRKGHSPRSQRIDSDDDDSSRDRDDIGRSERRSQYSDGRRGDRHGFRTDSRGQRKRDFGREKGMSRPLDSASHRSGYTQEGEGRRYPDGRYGRGKYQQGKSSNQRYENHSPHFHDKSYGELRREREDNRTKNPDDLRKNSRSEAIGSGPCGEEQEEDRDIRNVEINQRWKSVNYVTGENHGICKSMPKKFGVIDSDENEFDKARSEESLSDSDDDSIPRLNSNYNINGKLEHIYPGHIQELQSESWEDEIDPYATERNKFKNQELKKYTDHHKDRQKHYENVLKERVKEENEMDEELLRIAKEQTERQRSNVDENSENDSGVSCLSILDQFKRDRDGTTGAMQEKHSEKPESRKPRNYSKNTNDAKATSLRDDPHSHSSQSRCSHEESLPEEYDSQASFSEKHTAGHSNPAKDIKFCGSKSKKNSYHPPTSVDNRRENERLVSGDAFEQAWERRSALDKKSRSEFSKMDNEKGACVSRDEKSGRERIHTKNSGRRGNFRREGEKFKKKPQDKEMKGELPERRYGHSILEKPAHGTSVEANVRVVSFKKPKPLDMRTSNRPSSSVKVPDAANADKSTSRVSQDENSSLSQPVFQKPNLLDFRKQSGNPKAKSVPSKFSQESTKETSS